VVSVPDHHLHDREGRQQFQADRHAIADDGGDGPHYANNIALAGDGDYKLTYHFEPPSKAGFLRHVDQATGVPDWWQPFSETWTFHFPSKPAEWARDEDVFNATFTIRGHKFEPPELHVPAGRRIVLTVINTDPLSVEFDSSALKAEKVIAGGSQGIVRIASLNPGT
jgi:hypothetical protein